MNSMEKTRKHLKELGLPTGDDYNLTQSKKTFKDGAQYRFEVPGIQGPTAMKALLETLDEYGVHIHRITQTKGIMFLTDEEITEMVGYANKWGVELVLSIGPRATNDTSASVHTPEGQRMGYRLRGQEQIVRAIEEVKRANRLGCYSFILYDEGCLWIFDKFRKSGEISPKCKFKVSAHTGLANPCSAKLLEEIGADSVNPVRDIQLQMVAAIRDAIDVPIDLHTENPASSGGFVRHYEVPQMIKVAAPLYLKTGGAIAKTHSWESNAEDAKKRAKQIVLVKRVIDEYCPEATCSPKGSIE